MQLSLRKFYILFSVLYFIGSTFILDVKWRSGKYRTSIKLGFMYGRIEGRIVNGGFIWNYRKDKCSIYDNSGHNFTLTANKNKAQFLDYKIGLHTLRMFSKLPNNKMKGWCFSSWNWGNLGKRLSCNSVLLWYTEPNEILKEK